MQLKKTIGIIAALACTWGAAAEEPLELTLAEAIEDVKAGFERDDPNMDLLLDALYGEINANQWSDMITKEQADYLRSKYYYGDPHD